MCLIYKKINLYLKIQQIRTSSGVMVKVVHKGRYLNIYIEVPPRIYNNTAGLCGSFDGDASNDFTVFDTDYTDTGFKDYYRFV